MTKFPSTSIIPTEQSGLTASDYLRDSRNPVHAYLENLSSEKSKATMRLCLRSIVAIASKDGLQVTDVTDDDIYRFDWPGLTYAHTAEIRARLLKAYKPAGVNVRLSALRGVLKECWRLGYITEEQRARAADVPNVKVQQNKRDQASLAGRMLSIGELDSLLRSVAKRTDRKGYALELRAEDYRDNAILSLFMQTGMRRSEVASLAMDNVTLVNDGSKYNGMYQIVIQGKGDKQRTNYIASTRALQKWLEVRGDSPGYVFVPCKKNGRLAVAPDQLDETHKLTDQAIYYLCEKRRKQAGIEPFTPHDLRRTFISTMLDKQVGIDTVAEIAGHASVDTTRRYDRRGEHAKMEAANVLNVQSYI